MPRRQDLMYAVAVRDGNDLLLVVRIHRGGDGSVYVLWQRDKDWDPHTTYHASGHYWQRTEGQKLAPQLRQKLDASVRGSEMVISTGFTTTEVRAANVVCDPAKFADVFEIQSGDLPTRWRVCLSLHVTEDQHPVNPLAGMPAGIRLIQQATYGDGLPWLVVTFW